MDPNPYGLTIVHEFWCPKNSELYKIHKKLMSANINETTACRVLPMYLNSIPLSWLLDTDRATWIPSPGAMVTCRSRSSLALRPFIICWVRGMRDFDEEKVSLLTSSSNFSLHEKHKHYNFLGEYTVTVVKISSNFT